MSFAAGTKLGRYEIRSLIGARGMGEVYHARDPNSEEHITKYLERVEQGVK